MASTKRQSRRGFLAQLGSAGLLVAGAGCSIPLQVAGRAGWRPGKIRFGVIADVHENLQPNARERLIPFIEEMRRRRVDFIIQLGDFCHAFSTENRARFDDFMAIWNSFERPRYHVLGNHELDRCTKKEIMDYWGMAENYYSFDVGAHHFVVLDLNYLKLPEGDRDFANGNYFQHPEYLARASDAELDWLRRDLAATDKQTIVFSHYGVDHWDSDEKSEARRVLEQANRQAGSPKVVACFCGHYHQDGHKVINGIHYVRINSASYHWLGGRWKWVQYKDSLYATVALSSGAIEIVGKKSELVGPHPYELGFPVDPDRNISAEILDRRLRIPARRARNPIAR